MIKGNIPLFAYHYERLTAGMKALRLDTGKDYGKDFFAAEIERLTEHAEADLRLRLSVFRAPGGLYTPLDPTPYFLIEADRTTGGFPMNTAGITLTFYDEVFITGNYKYNRLAGIKSANALPYVLAARHARTYGFTESFMFNDRDFVAECQASNYFLWDGKNFTTPSLKTGCVAGVMRRALLKIIAASGQKCREIDEPAVRDIFAAKGVILTNAVQGLRWVKKIDHTDYEKPKCFEALAEEVAGLG